MTYESMDELQEAIVDDLKVLLRDDAMFDADILEVKVKNAIKEVKGLRKYPKCYCECMIVEDFEENLYATAFNLALFDYNMSGAEGELYHYENTVHRSFPHRRELLDSVLPIASVF